MLVHSRVEIPCEPGPWSSGASSVLRILRAAVVPTEGARFELHVRTGANALALLEVARLLPVDARGFSLGSIHEMTAGEFIHACNESTPHAGYRGWPTDHITFERTLEVLDRLRQAKPGMLRGMTVSFHCHHLHWKGAQSSTNGQLAFLIGPKRVATSHADAQLRGTRCDDPAVVAEFKAISAATGLDFLHGRLTSTAEPDSSETHRMRAIRAVCSRAALDEALAAVRDEGFDPRSVPGVMGEMDALGDRIRDRLSGGSGRVDFTRVAKRCVKALMPGWRCAETSGDGMTLQKPLSDSVQALCGFDRIHFHGLGKAFTLKVGMESTLGGQDDFTWRVNLFEAFGESGLCFSYATTEELEKAIADATVPLSRLLAVFEPALVRWLTPLPSEMPVSVPVTGAVTARQGYMIASAVARNWSSGPSFLGMGMLSSVEGASIELEEGTRGRLPMGGAWVCGFSSSSRHESLAVTVPYAGAVRQVRSVNMPGVQGGPAPIREGWMDSDRAVAHAVELARQNWGGAVDEQSASVGSLNAKRSDRARWLIYLKGTASRGRATGLWVSFDAFDGSDAKVTCP